MSEAPEPQLEAQLEAVLFAAGDPVPLASLADWLDQEPSALAKQLLEIQQAWAADERRGTYLRAVDDQYTLATKPAYQPWVAKLYDPQTAPPLTMAAYEALAVIAYNQPVTRAQVEAVRGTNSDGLIHRLIERGLVEDQGRSEAPGRPTLFGTTERFLETFGLNSLQALPPMELLMYGSLQALEENLQAATGAQAIRQQIELDRSLDLSLKPQDMQGGAR